MTDWMVERNQDLGSYAYAADMKKIDDEGALDLLSLEYLVEANACVLGTPEDCIETCRLYEEAGIDLLLCLVNPYKIPHEAVMQTIELMGTEVIPAFADRARAPAGAGPWGKLWDMGRVTRREGARGGDARQRRRSAPTTGASASRSTSWRTRSPCARRTCRRPP